MPKEHDDSAARWTQAPSRYKEIGTGTADRPLELLLPRAGRSARTEFVSRKNADVGEARLRNMEAPLAMRVIAKAMEFT